MGAIDLQRFDQLVKSLIRALANNTILEEDKQCVHAICVYYESLTPKLVARALIKAWNDEAFRVPIKGRRLNALATYCLNATSELAVGEALEELFIHLVDKSTDYYTDRRIKQAELWNGIYHIMNTLGAELPVVETEQLIHLAVSKSPGVSPQAMARCEPLRIGQFETAYSKFLSHFDIVPTGVVVWPDVFTEFKAAIEAEIPFLIELINDVWQRQAQAETGIARYFDGEYTEWFERLPLCRGNTPDFQSYDAEERITVMLSMVDCFLASIGLSALLDIDAVRELHRERAVDLSVITKENMETVAGGVNAVSDIVAALPRVTRGAVTDKDVVELMTHAMQQQYYMPPKIREFTDTGIVDISWCMALLARPDVREALGPAGKLINAPEVSLAEEGLEGYYAQ